MCGLNKPHRQDLSYGSHKFGTFVLRKYLLNLIFIFLK